MTKNSKTDLSASASHQSKESISDERKADLKESSFGSTSEHGATQTDSNPVNENEKLDADQILTEDHRKVKRLFEAFEATIDLRDKERLCKEICIQLIIHTKLEEELLYPECRAKGVESHLLEEAQVEHDSAKILIGELISLPADSAYYDAKVKVLSEYIKHHVGEEEKASDGIFAKARSAGVDMTALGMRLQLRKKELLAKGEASILQPPKPRSLETKFNFINPYFQESQIMTGRNDPNRDEYGRFTDNTHRGSSDDYSNERYEDRRYGNDQNRGRRSTSYYGDRDRD